MAFSIYLMTIKQLYVLSFEYNIYNIKGHINYRIQNIESHKNKKQESENHRIRQSCNYTTVQLDPNSTSLLQFRTYKHCNNNTLSTFH